MVIEHERSALKDIKIMLHKTTINVLRKKNLYLYN